MHFLPFFRKGKKDISCSSCKSCLILYLTNSPGTLPKEVELVAGDAGGIGDFLYSHGIVVQHEHSIIGIRVFFIEAFPCIKMAD